MAMTYTYPDAYLYRLMTEDIEARALADVVEIRSDFPAAWLERLTRLRAYVTLCLESVSKPDDLFTMKLAQYRKEFDQQLVLARAAADAAARSTYGNTTAGAASPFSIEMYRS
jgi:hypothetical protein